MNSFILRVTAHHGEPQLVGKIHVRAGITVDTPFTPAEIVNDPHGTSVVDIADQEGKSGSSYGIDQLINDFEDEYGCKVAYGEEIDPTGSADVREFDVFEPSWPEDTEAEDVVEDLTQRITDWINGYPTGR